MTRPTSGDPYSRDPYEGIDPLEGRGEATERLDAAERLDDARPADRTERLDRAALAEPAPEPELFDEAPLDAAPDELEERAERRGLGKGLLIGAIAAALLGLLAFWLLNWGPMQQRPAADNTVPVTSLPNDGTLQPDPSQTAGPADGGPATAPAPSSPALSPSAADAQPAETTAAPTTTGQPSGELGVALTRWNWIPEQRMIAVAGFVPHVEQGGTCTLTATKDGQAVSQSAPASPDAQTTVCAITLGSEQLTPGTWGIVLSYEGPGGSGASPSAQVEVTG